MLVMVVPIFWIGIHPDPFLRRIEPSVIEVLHRVDLRTRPAAEADEPAPRPEARP